MYPANPRQKDDRGIINTNPIDINAKPPDAVPVGIAVEAVDEVPEPKILPEIGLIRSSLMYASSMLTCQ